jgi:uncharacterized protein YwbE
MFGGKITQTQVKELLTKGVTARELDLKTRDGNPFKARLEVHQGRVGIRRDQTLAPSSDPQQ